MSTDWYSKDPQRFLERYEQVSFEQIHSDVLPFLEAKEGRALDIGCGSGRDAAWLARRRWQVDAVDRSEPMLSGAMRLHPDAGIQWINDELPFLQRVRGLNRVYDFVLASAVWMHIPARDQIQSARTVGTLLAPSGLLSISIRQGIICDERTFDDVDVDAMLETFSRTHIDVFSDFVEDDVLGRSALKWRRLLLKLRV